MRELPELPDLTALEPRRERRPGQALWDIVGELRQEVVGLKAEISKLQTEVI